MAITYTLTAEPTTATGSGFAAGALLYNQGPGTAYAADTPGNEVDGFPIRAGASMTWDAQRPLYLTSSAGAVLVLDQDSGSSLFNPADIASQILDQGLAGDIAASIKAGGVPVVDAPLSLSNVISAPAPLGVGPFDMTPYASVFFNVTIATTSPLSISDIVKVTIAFGNSGLITSGITIEGNAGCIITGYVPVTGPQMQFAVTTPSLTASTYTVTTNVFASYRTVAHPSYTVSNNNWDQPYMSGFGQGSYVNDSMSVSRMTDYYLVIPGNGGSGQQHITAFPSYCSGPMTWSPAYFSGAIAPSGYDHYLATSDSLALVAGQYGITSTTQSPLLVPSLQFGSRQPLLAFNNRSNNTITLRGFLGGSHQ